MRDSTLREISVGPADADVVGTDNRAIQIAVDALASRGGGTVRVLPGEYICADSIHLRANVDVVGDREGTVLRLARLAMSPLAVDADKGQKEIVPVDCSGFREGMGVIVRSKRSPNAMSDRPLTVCEVSNGKLLTTDYLMHTFEAGDEGLVVSYFSLIHGWQIESVVVDGFTVDGTPDGEDGLDDMWCGGVHFEWCRHCTVRNVTSRNCRGDGIQIFSSEHCSAEDCESAHNTHYGIHPGGHSPWTNVRRCHIHHNGSDGLYLCWGAREGFYEDNAIHHNGHRLHRNGLSIGHRDTDNVIARNHVYENHKHGVCFRVENEGNGGHRNVLRENVIENNGCPEEEVPEPLRAERRFEVECCGIFVRGVTHDLTFERNVIRETREGEQRHQRNAIFLDEGVCRLKMAGNEISEHPGGKIVDETGSPDNDLQGL